MSFAVAASSPCEVEVPSAEVSRGGDSGRSSCYKDQEWWSCVRKTSWMDGHMRGGGVCHGFGSAQEGQVGQSTLRVLREEQGCQARVLHCACASPCNARQAGTHCLQRRPHARCRLAQHPANQIGCCANNSRQVEFFQRLLHLTCVRVCARTHAHLDMSYSPVDAVCPC